MRADDAAKLAPAPADGGCHALDCDAPAMQATWFCAGHWRVLPPAVQDVCVRAYDRPSATARPLLASTLALGAAVSVLARMESRDPRRSPVVQFAALMRQGEEGEAALAAMGAAVATPTSGCPES